MGAPGRVHVGRGAGAGAQSTRGEVPGVGARGLDFGLWGECTGAGAQRRVDEARGAGAGT